MTASKEWREFAIWIRGRCEPRHPIRLTIPTALHPERIQDFVHDAGLPAAPEGDYRLPLPDGTGLHVQAMGADQFLAHWDEVDPCASADHRLQHGLIDAPLQTIALGAGVGALLNLLLEGKGGAAAGMKAGAGIATAGVALANLKRVPRHRGDSTPLLLDWHRSFNGGVARPCATIVLP